MEAGAAPPTNASGVDLNKHPSGVVPILQNIVATVNLNTKLDLKEIALHARNAEYNPKRFAAVIMRIREPKTTALIFASGKMVVTGAKSEEDSHSAARRYAKIVQKLGFPATFKDFKIQNMVGSCDVKFPIRLEGLAYQQTLFSSYEPELFPGLIYRMKVPKVVLLIFVSGKVVLTGAKKRDEIYAAFENIYPVLTGFRKGDAAASALALPPGARLPALPAPAAPGAAAAVAGTSAAAAITGAVPNLRIEPAQAGPAPPAAQRAAAAAAPQGGFMQLPPPTPMR